METIVRINLESIITRKLNEGDKGLAEAIELATLEYAYPEDVIPHLEESFYMAGNTDEVLRSWSGILNDFDKVCRKTD